MNRVAVDVCFVEPGAWTRTRASGKHRGIDYGSGKDTFPTLLVEGGWDRKHFIDPGKFLSWFSFQLAARDFRRI